MAEIQKTETGIFIPRKLISDFERVEVDVSTPGEIIIRSKGRHVLDEVIARIDRRREEIFRQRGLLEDSVALVLDGRETELR